MLSPDDISEVSWRSMGHPGWVLLLQRGELDEQSVAVYEVVEG